MNVRWLTEIAHSLAKISCSPQKRLKHIIQRSFTEWRYVFKPGFSPLAVVLTECFFISFRKTLLYKIEWFFFLPILKGLFPPKLKLLLLVCLIRHYNLCTKHDNGITVTDTAIVCGTCNMAGDRFRKAALRTILVVENRHGQGCLQMFQLDLFSLPSCFPKIQRHLHNLFTSGVTVVLKIKTQIQRRHYNC